MATNKESTALVPTTLAETQQMARIFASSNLLPPDLRGKEADVFVAIVAGRELGLAPMAALRGVHVVKGKPILSADTMVAVALGSGACEYFTCVNESDESVTYETKRTGTPPQRLTWTSADAKRANLDGDNWRKYPRAMLKARCKAALARDVYPDALAGCYEESERAEIEPVRAVSVAHTAAVNADAIDAEIVSEQPSSSLIERMRAATTIDALKALVKECQALPDGSEERNVAKAEYRACMDRLAKQGAAA